DATREVGAALGVAVLGSIAISHFAHDLDPLVRDLPPQSQEAASSSLGGALAIASGLGGETGQALTEGARHAFVGGIHPAAYVGGSLVVVAAAAVWRYLPHSVSHAGAEQGHHSGAPRADLAPGAEPAHS